MSHSALSVRIFFFTVATVAARCQPPGASGDQQQQLLSFQLQAANAFLRTFSDHYLFSGTVAYSRAGNLTFNAAYVAESSAASNPIGYNDVFPLGTGALSYIAAAAYQLHSVNAIDLDQPLTAYLDPMDFSHSSQWCPQVYGMSSNASNGSTESALSPTPEQAACSTASLRQILGMTAGLVDVAGCNYTAGSWQRDYCLSSAPYNANLYQDAAAGNITVAELISTFLWQTPLESNPGEGFRISPAGYWFVVYIIEKVTGLTLAEYLEANIFRPANLGSTSSGTPSSPVASNLSDLAVAVPGFSSAFTPNVSVAPAFLPQGTYANTTELVPMGDENLLVAGLGSIWASAADLIAWYQTLLASPGVVSLEADMVTQMLTPAPLAMVAENFYFAQGFGVVPRADSPLLIDALAVTGRFAGVKTSVYIQVSRSSMPVLDGLAVFTNTEPRFIDFGSANVTAECAVAFGNGQSNMQVPCRIGYDGGKVTNAVQQTLLAGLEMTDDPTAIIYSEF